MRNGRAGFSFLVYTISKNALIDDLYFYGICFVGPHPVGRSHPPFCEETA